MRGASASQSLNETAFAPIDVAWAAAMSIKFYGLLIPPLPGEGAVNLRGGTDYRQPAIAGLRHRGSALVGRRIHHGRWRSFRGPFPTAVRSGRSIPRGLLTWPMLETKWCQSPISKPCVSRGCRLRTVARWAWSQGTGRLVREHLLRPSGMLAPQVSCICLPTSPFWLAGLAGISIRPHSAKNTLPCSGARRGFAGGWFSPTGCAADRASSPRKSSSAAFALRPARAAGRRASRRLPKRERPAPPRAGRTSVALVRAGTPSRWRSRRR